MKIKCLGCGATIQSTNPDKPGFIDAKVLEKKNGDFYCKRCFDLKHYNKQSFIHNDYDEYLKNLEKIKKAKGFIVNIVDLLDLDGSLIKNINTIFKSEDILLVINKVDLFLDSINLNKIYSYVRKHIKDLGIKVKDVILISSFKDQDIELLLDKISELNENNKDVYFVGMTNVGKSTILNKIITKFTGEKDIITVSGSVNTTLGNIVIPFNDKINFIDTPGIINEKNLVYYLDKESLDYIRPKSFIRPKTFQLNPFQSLFIAGFARIDFVQGERSSFISNFANNVLIHRTKLENADDFYSSHKDDLLIYPNNQERERLGELICLEENVEEYEKIDICFNGLGYMTFNGVGVLKIYYFKNVGVEIRKAMI